MKRRVLGKGLESIIANKPALGGESGTEIIQIPVGNIFPNPEQPRKKFSQDSIRELAESLAESGLIQPVVVFVRKDKYFLVVGERRWRAAQLLEWEKIPAIVRTYSEDEVVVGALVENIQREDLNALEVAEGIDALMRRLSVSQEEAARKLGMSRSTLTNYLRLLVLPEVVKQGLVSGDISQGHARVLIPLPEQAVLDVFAQIVEKKWSVRQTEQYVSRLLEKNEGEKRNVGDKEVDMRSMEERLEQLLGTRVKLQWNRKGVGKLEVYFKKIEEFDRLVSQLSRSES